MKKECIFPEDPNEDLGYLIWQIMKTWQRGKQRLLDEFGLTGPQLEILSAVYHMSQARVEVTQIAISNLTNVDPMTTSTILRNLEKKKLVRRRLSETDTRARLVEMTEFGEELFEKATNKIKCSMSKLTEKIDQEKLKFQLRELLDILTELNQSN